MEQKIIIIGASSGIGKALAALYASDGNKVGITGRRTTLLEQVQQQFPGRIFTSGFDVTGNDNIHHLETLVNDLGGLDLLIISAGTGEPSAELRWEIDKTTIRTNVLGFTEIANWAFNYFVKQGHGQLAAISSVAAVRGGSWAPAYNASKAFQSSYLNGLSVKASKLKKNIAITCIEPGFVKTEMAKSNQLFWVVPLEKAAGQIKQAIARKRRQAYISRRWWLVAQLLKYMPHWLYKKVS